MPSASTADLRGSTPRCCLSCRHRCPKPPSHFLPVHAADPPDLRDVALLRSFVEWVFGPGPALDLDVGRSTFAGRFALAAAVGFLAPRLLALVSPALDLVATDFWPPAARLSPTPVVR